MAAALELSSLSLFSRDVRKAPRLDRAEGARLARRWHAHGDREAARQLVVANLYGVAAIAREYRHFGLPEMDLIQEGTLGLMHAVKRFDPERGFRLMSYASWWVRAAIHEFILQSWSIVKLGTNKLQRRIFAGLQKAKNAIAAFDGSKADEVAGNFSISGAEYQAVANAFLQRDTRKPLPCLFFGALAKPLRSASQSVGIVFSITITHEAVIVSMRGKQFMGVFHRTKIEFCSRQNFMIIGNEAFQIYSGRQGAVDQMRCNRDGELFGASCELARQAANV